MPDSSDPSDENLPITDEPTQEFSDFGGDDDSMGFDFEEAPVDSNDEIVIPSQIGDYAIKKAIGSGGMGQVLLAEHVRMQRVVAIKMLRNDRMRDEASISRFYEEVRAASRLMHPNIVAAFDAGDYEGIHYLAMEYVDGATLTDIIVQRGPMDVGEAASVIRQAALGLLHAHRADIVHRDIKPSNIMRASDGTIKVLDMGLAQISSSRLVEDDGEIKEAEQSAKGKLVGTLAYMSPEQLESPEDADPRSDIYSLGAVLYFLLTGRPPFTGEYLDQVYGHRHGEIPDLMQARNDVDLTFANIFRRMMAKRPSQRYASLDEVIDDLGGYADTSNAPLWLAEFTRRQTKSEGSTFSGGSTTGSTGEILAIELGMFYSAAAIASPLGAIDNAPAGGGSLDDPSVSQSLLRMAMASTNDELLYGTDAMELRSTNPSSVVHCLPMYIGKDVVDREFCGERCPPEVLLGMLVRRAVKNAWPHNTMPEACAITVPASYDQLHRRSILQAARMAGLSSVRLVDRSVAAAQLLLIDNESTTTLQASDSGLIELQGDASVQVTAHDTSEEELLLFIGITGQAAEVAVIRRDAARVQQLSSAGHWHTGSLAWLHQLVDLVSAAFIEMLGVDPRKSPKTAPALQIACERAMNSLLLLPLVKVTIDIDGKPESVSVHRRHWLEKADGLLQSIKKNVDEALQRANVSLDEIKTCVTLGPLMRTSEVRQILLGDAQDRVTVKAIDRADVAKGAASCLAAELPGRGDAVMPPRAVGGQAIGIFVEDARGRRRILPIIPRGTALPARTNRRLTVGKTKEAMTLSLVESSGIHGDDWHSLGRYDFEIEASANRTKRVRMIGFELNTNGILRCRAQTPGTPGSTVLESLPATNLDEESIRKWSQWIEANA